MPTAIAKLPLTTADERYFTPADTQKIIANLEQLAVDLAAIYDNHVEQYADNSITKSNGKTQDTTMGLSGTIAQLRKYTDHVLQRAFGSGGTVEKAAQKPQSIEMRTRERTRKSFRTPAPAKNATDSHVQEPVLTPFDDAFQSLQDEMRKLLEESELLLTRIQTLVNDNESNYVALDKLDDRSTHRLHRARVRHIRFTTKLEEEWLKDPESLALCHCVFDPEAKMPRCCDAT